MQAFARWTTRLLSQPVVQKLQLPMRISIHSTRCFSSSCPSLETLDKDPEQLTAEQEAKRKKRREYSRKYFRADEKNQETRRSAEQKYYQKRRADPAWVAAKNQSKREYNARRYRDDPEDKRRRRFRAWVLIEQHLSLIRLVKLVLIVDSGYLRSGQKSSSRPCLEDTCPDTV